MAIGENTGGGDSFVVVLLRVYMAFLSTKLASCTKDTQYYNISQLITKSQGALLDQL